MDWLKALDFEQALKNVRRDLYGDWFRDPWSWPELSWIVKNRLDLASERLDASGVSRASPLDVAKENFGIRPAIVMDPLDRLAYQALVDSISGKLGVGMKETVFGWRLPRDEQERGHYAPNGIENELYRKHISVYGAHDGMAGLKTDIVSFFANIPIDRLAERIFERSRKTELAKRLVDMLNGWDQTGPSRGLPQRSAASAFLANLYLQPVDDAVLQNIPKFRHGRSSDLRDLFRSLHRRERQLDKGQSARWMDDIWIFRRDEGELRQFQREVESLLRDLKLDMNSAKTSVLSGEPLRAEVLNFARSAVDADLSDEPIDDTSLREMIDRIIEEPEATSRSTIRFAFRRMRDHQIEHRIHDLVDIYHKAPHAADAFARLFRDSGAYRDLHSWYVRYWKSNWSVSDWATAELGTMIPSTNVRKALREQFAAYIANPGGSLSLTSLAAQRLSAKAPSDFRSALRAAVKASEHPLELRALALASLACDEERQFIRTALSNFKENQPLLLMLEDTSFRPPPVAKDFGGW